MTSKLLSDTDIRALCHDPETGVPHALPMIRPFRASLVRNEDTHKVLSFGCSSYGYDARLAANCKLVAAAYDSNGTLRAIDPKNYDPRCTQDLEVQNGEEGQYIIVPTHGFVLGRTVEYFHMPKDTLAICIGKSTYARCGLIVNVTPLEPGWEGTVTLELHNTTMLPIKVYVNEGICQFLFFQNEPCAINYKDRQVKYDGHLEVTLPKV